MFYTCVEPGTPTEEVISVLSKGTSLHKVRYLDKFYSRRYFVDLHNMRLHYSPSKKRYVCQEVPYGISLFINFKQTFIIHQLNHQKSDKFYIKEYIKY